MSPLTTYLIMCKNQTAALRLADYLSGKGFYASLTRPPAGITGGDCSFAVKVAERQLIQALAALNESGLRHGKVYAYFPDGRTQLTNA
ncbi:MAG: DUF3343 domain-containing protein [Oscillospiraceae bacterium]|jgi:hypothetical protein|nr:DUF3343 domain-containing protein [Oscillospiraceae bacterium]